MTKATMISRERLFFACPHCGEEEAHEVTHFLQDRRFSFGPWQCDACGWVVSGKWDRSTKTVEITELREQIKPIIGWLLLKIRDTNTVWLIVKDIIHTRDHRGGALDMAAEIEHKRYWVDEHTCPTNIIRIAAIIEQQGNRLETDPHGVLQFVAFAPRPDGWDEGAEPTDWSEVFPQLLEDSTVIDARAEAVPLAIAGNKA